MRPDPINEIPQAWRWLLDDQVDLDALPDDVGTMMELIGRPATVKLLVAFAGTQVYFPSLKQAFARHRAGQIRRAFTGSNHKQLAVKFGISTTTVYSILKEAPLTEEK